MEDKQYLDEAGLGEVGKVISKFYASKEDIKNIDVTKQLDDYAKKTDLDNKVDKVDGKQLSTNDYTNEDKESMDDWGKKQKWNEFLEWCTLQIRDVVNGTPDFALVDGTYNIRLNERISGNGDELDPRVSAWGYDVTPSNEWSYKLLSSQTMSIDGEVRLIVKKLNINFQPVSSKNEKCFVSQEIVNPINNISITRITQKPKIEYSDEHIFQLWQNKNKDVNFEEIVTHDDWGQWSVVSADWRAPTLFPVMPETTKAGLMLPEDKKKLDSIDVEAINSANKSNANTIKVCDVKKEILSKGADAPIGLYMNNNTIKPFLELYCVRRNPFNGTTFYDVNRLGQGAFFYNQLTEHYIWKDNRWQTMETPSLTAESGSIYYQLNELAGRVDRLESAMRLAGLLAPEPAQ